MNKVEFIQVPVVKKQDGIYIDGELKLLKSFTLYMIEFKDNLDSKKEAEKIWDELSAIEILIKYFGKKIKN